MRIRTIAASFAIVAVIGGTGLMRVSAAPQAPQRGGTAGSAPGQAPDVPAPYAGAPMDLARKIKPALDLIGRGAKPAPPSSAAPAPAAAPAAGALDGQRIAQIVGRTGDQTGAVYKITVGRDDLKITEMGAPIGTR